MQGVIGRNAFPCWLLGIEPGRHGGEYGEGATAILFFMPRILYASSATVRDPRPTQRRS